MANPAQNRPQQAPQKPPWGQEAKDFKWLKRGCRGPSYTSYFQYSHLPYCSFEWGDKGYAGCSNHGGELLYLSRPSKKTGLIMVRGHFATSLYASLSRSQIDFGGPSTFGLEVTRSLYAYDSAGVEITQDDIANETEVSKGKAAKNGSSFELGTMIDRGCFNYRWPVTEYYLDLHEDQEAIETAKRKELEDEQAEDEQAKENTIPPLRAILERLELNKGADEETDDDSEAEDVGGESSVDENDGSGAQQQEQNTALAEANSSKNVGNSSVQHAQSTPSGETSIAAGVGAGSTQQAPNTPSLGEDSSEMEVEEDEQERDGTSQCKHVGTCQMFSCSMDGMFYQLLRIEELREDGDFDMSFPADSQIRLTMGGPVWFQSFKDGDHDLVAGEGVLKPGSGHDSIMKGSKMSGGGGGMMTMRPSFSLAIPEKKPGSNGNGELKEEVIDTSPREKPKTITYWAEDKDKEGKGRGLQARVYQFDPDDPTSKDGYKQLELIKSETEADSGPKDNNAAKSKLTAYNAVVPLKKEPHHRQFGQTSTPRSYTFLVAIRLFEGRKRGSGHWPKLPSSEQLYDHIAVHPLHENATGAMWESVFLDPRKYGKGPEPVLDLVEFNMIGRSLEKILQVDIVPATFFDDDEHELDDPNRKEYSALVSNLFVKGNVDLKALFWKIRFLISVHELLSYIHNPPSKKASDIGKAKESLVMKETEEAGNSESQGSLDKGKGKATEGPESKEASDEDKARKAEETMRTKFREEFQLKRIQRSIEDVVRYLAKVMLEQISPMSYTRMIPDYHIPGESNNYYVLMTIWYVWKYFSSKVDKEYKFDWQGQPEKRKNMAHLPMLLESHHLPAESWAFAKADIDKVHLLQWYHYGSLLKLCRSGVLHTSWLEGGLEQKVARLANAAKMVSSGKLSSRQPYVADDEIFDRLSFLSDELGLETLKPEDVGAVASLSMKRVKQRDYTRTLNPGWIPRNKEGSTSGPWEIYALCHHSRLVVLTKEEKSKQDWRTREHTHSEAVGFRKSICNFLNAEGTLIPCWERAHTKYRRGWLRSEATSVVATTFIFILYKMFDEADRPEPEEDIAATEENNLAQSLADLAGTTHSADNDKRLRQEVVHLGGLMKGQLDAFERFMNESGLQPPIVWTSFRPPLTYHPLNFFTSLEDTPDEYKCTALSKASVPLSLHKDVLDPPRDFEKKDVVEIFTDPVTRDLIFLFDIKATRKDEDEDGFTWKIKNCQYNIKEGTEKDELKDSKIVWALYDSLVDQEVQHRFLTVKPLRPIDRPVEIPKKILNLLVYVLHPESATCLGDHIRDILNFSRFSCQRGDNWVASITLRSWRVSYKEEFVRDKPRDPKCQNSSDDFYLPTNLKYVWEKVGEKVESVNSKTIFRPEVSSIVLSTNSFGDFSKCTVVSEFMNRKKMLEISKEARKLWQKFIHQPQTARCLVFFLILGKMCETITKRYEKAIETLSAILTLDSTFTNKADEYPLEYELGVWSLDALYKLQNSLNATVASLLKAKEELTAQITAGPGKRSVRLEGMCREYLGTFEDNFMQLTAVNVQLNRRIELNTRNKDATSAILAMRDSRTAISQNGTVQRLTYLTIGYLPIALMAAIFAIPKEQNVLYWPRMADHGRSWFVGAIFIISFFTYGLAVYIGAILGFLKNFFKIPPELRPGAEEKNKKKTGHGVPLNIWRPLAPSLIWMRQNWWVGDFKQKEGEVQEEDSPNLWRRGFKWMKATWLVGDFKEKKEGEVEGENPRPKDLPNLWGGIGFSFKWMKASRLGGYLREDDNEQETRDPKSERTDPLNAAEQGQAKLGSDNATESNGLMQSSVIEVTEGAV